MRRRWGTTRRGETNIDLYQSVEIVFVLLCVWAGFFLPRAWLSLQSSRRECPPGSTPRRPRFARSLTCFGSRFSTDPVCAVYSITHRHWRLFYLKYEPPILRMLGLGRLKLCLLWVCRGWVCSPHPKDTLFVVALVLLSRGGVATRKNARQPVREKRDRPCA